MKRNGKSPKSSGVANRRTRALLDRARRLALNAHAGQPLDGALALLRKAAENGSEEAEYAIGTWYAFGEWLPQSDEKAAKHFKRAARKNYGPALFNLAVCFETGRGVRKDLSRAFGGYVRAAREGDVEAAHSVYRCLYYGIGVPRDKAIAELVGDLVDGTFASKRKAAVIRKSGDTWLGERSRRVSKTAISKRK